MAGGSCGVERARTCVRRRMASVFCPTGRRVICKICHPRWTIRRGIRGGVSCSDSERQAVELLEQPARPRTPAATAAQTGAHRGFPYGTMARNAGRGPCRRALAYLVAVPHRQPHIPPAALLPALVRASGPGAATANVIPHRITRGLSAGLQGSSRHPAQCRQAATYVAAWHSTGWAKDQRARTHLRRLPTDRLAT